MMRFLLLLFLTAICIAEYRLDVREWGVIEGEYNSDSFSFHDFSFPQAVHTQKTVDSAKITSAPSSEVSHSCPNERFQNPEDKKKFEELGRAIEKLKKKYDKAEGKEREKLEKELKKLMIKKLELRLSRTRLAKEPVIYFDLENVEHFSVRATFTTGTPTVTYPPAEIISNSCVWDSVHPVQDAPLNKMMQIPEQQRREILRINNVKSQALQVNSFKTRSLFYEGELQFHNNITWSFRGDSVLVTNEGSYDVSNCYLLKDDYGARTRVAFIKKLSAGEKRMVETEWFHFYTGSKTVEPSTEDILIEQGFRSDEAGAFTRIWDEKLINRADKWGSCSFYQIPQSEVVKLIPLEIKPKPTSILRTLFVLTGKEKQ